MTDNEKNGIKLIKVDAFSPQSDIKNLKDYFIIRQKKFPNGSYLEKASDYDLDPDNLDNTKRIGAMYVLALKDNKVAGGCGYFPRTLNHPLPLEKRFDLRKLLSEVSYTGNISIEKIKCGEIGGLAVADAYQGKGLGAIIEVDIFKLAREETDIFVESVGYLNLTTILKAAEMAGLDALILGKKSIKTQIGLSVPMIFSAKHKFKEIFEKIRDNGDGVPIHIFIHNIKDIQMFKPNLFNKEHGIDYDIKQDLILKELRMRLNSYAPLRYYHE